MKSWFVNNLDSRIYTKKFIEDNKQIKLHHLKYRNNKYAPAWKTFEFLTFGAIVTIFNALKENDIKDEISKVYGLDKLKAFKNFIHTIKHTRNICAHSGVVYDLNYPMGIFKIPKTKFTNNNNQSLDAGIKTISYILGTISERRKKDMEDEIEELFNKHKTDEIKYIITDIIGYNL